MEQKSKVFCGAIAAIALALTLPLAAQQTAASPNQNAPNAAQTAQQPAAAQPAAPASAAVADNSQPDPNANVAKANAVAQQPLQADEHEGFWGRLNPFARKKYVQQHLQPVRDRVNELDGLTASNAKMLADVDARSSAGIATAQSNADQANQQANAAAQAAQQAATQANQLDQQVATVQTNLANADQYQVAQTATIGFRPGVARLNSQAQTSLQQFLGNLAQQNGYVVEVTAYSAGRGAAAVRNSRRLARAMVRYLVMDENIPLYRIYTVGLGNAPMAVAGAAPRRLRHGGRVTVRILRNSLAASGNNTAAAAAANPANPQ
ncbi:MAG: hypothetical protein ACRD2F_02300 [Terriglobales bacterium]